MKAFARAELERQRYRLGQRLRSRDFSDQLDAEAHLRWWHNRALHNAYGVASGYRTEIAGDAVIVGRGLAYDCFGRELELRRELEIALPLEERPGWILVVAAGDTETAEPVLRWRSGRITPADGVPIFAVGADLEPLGSSLMPLARPLARPRIGHGATMAGKTAWRNWEILRSDGVEPLTLGGVEVTIDTSAAGFTERPCYFAWLQGGSGPVVVEDSNPNVTFGLSRRFVMPSVIDRVTEAGPESFVFSLWDMNTASFQHGATLGPLLQLARRQLFVCWLGIQMWPEATDELFFE